MQSPFVRFSLEKVHCAWFAVDDTLVVGLASVKNQNATDDNPKQVLVSEFGIIR